MTPMANTHDQVRLRETRGRASFHTPVPRFPDERLRVVWDDYSGGAENKSDRHLIGTAVLAILLGLALVATTRTARTP